MEFAPSQVFGFSTINSPIASDQDRLDFEEIGFKRIDLCLELC